MELPSITKSRPSRVEVRKVNSTLKFSPNVMFSRKKCKKISLGNFFLLWCFPLVSSACGINVWNSSVNRYYNYSHTVSSAEGCSVSYRGTLVLIMWDDL